MASRPTTAVPAPDTARSHYRTAPDLGGGRVSPERDRAAAHIQRGSVGEAVSTAVNASEISHFSPDLVAHIAQTVIQQLQSTNLDGIATSNNNSTGAAHQAQPSHTQTRTQPAPQQPIHVTSIVPPAQMVASPIMESRYSPRMSNSGTYFPPSPERSSDAENKESPKLRADAKATSSEDNSQPQVQFQPQLHFQPQVQSSKDDATGKTRPKGPVRLSTANGETPLEKIWGTLFDDEAQPMPRLSQVLRGLARHLVRQNVVV